jgi:hypothetical protein
VVRKATHARTKTQYAIKIINLDVDGDAGHASPNANATTTRGGDVDDDEEHERASIEDIADEIKVRSIHWSPYDRVGDVDADP